MTRSRLGSSAVVAFAIGALALGSFGATAQAEGTPHWGYEGADGPAHWGSLSPDWITCVDGSAQSPIDITTVKAAHLRDLDFSYQRGSAQVFNNGHTVEAQPASGDDSTLTVAGTTYAFAQLHFHAHSEHEVAGKAYPLEIHFVHKTADGKIAVVGMFVKEGRPNAAWARIVQAIPGATEDPAQTVVRGVDWLRLLPANKQTIRYDGSLTTPGCAEGVKWNVMTTPIEMSKAQLAAFTNEYDANFRPVQPLNGRVPLLDISVG